jgi:diguanylate cyclase (GGDEF)-like protein/PAS domain S-box-containing protein
MPSRGDRSSYRSATASAFREQLRSAGSDAIVRGFPEGVLVVFDEELRFLCAGGKGLTSVGLTQETIEGKTIFEVFPAEVAATLVGPYRDALSGQEASLEIRLGDRTYLHRVSPLGDADGGVVAGIGIAFEVTGVRQAELEQRESERILREERRRLRDAEAIGRSGSWEWDTVADVITWSDGLFVLHGLDPTEFPGGYGQAAARVHPDDRESVDAAIEACRRHEQVQFRYRVLRASDGEERWFNSRASGVFEDRNLMRLIGAVADVTEQLVAEAEVVEANAFQHAVIAASPDYTFITDVNTGAMIYGSRDRDLLGYSKEFTESLGPRVIEVLVHPDDQAELRDLNTRASALEDGDVLDLRYRLRHADGEWRWQSRHVVPFRRDASGSVIEVLGVLRDITDVVAAEDLLTHGALHDGLTGLPNRELLFDRLDAALLRSEREHRTIAVLFCDLDGFKQVNDTAGHAAGDRVLIETARRLQNTVRDGDTVARVGGDEFVLVIEPWNRADSDSGNSHLVDDEGLALRVADRVVSALRVPIDVDGVPHHVTVSVGVRYSSGGPGDGAATPNARTFIEEADEAMYQAKHQGKNRFTLFA